MALELGLHSVKLIGWGEENGVPYWMLVNSWGSDWGENGTFRIRRGTNECGIEKEVTAGIPMSNSQKSLIIIMLYWHYGLIILSFYYVYIL